ncbi:MAG: DegT/DnrJ/EryC1/StrS family aminotransferase [Lachnospiraceae bacterium]|nr:DegT/DnrJ/EryC1/StrS family aminotransferase [Lachnospiraceae bacterium]
MDKILVTRASMPSYEEYIDKIKVLWDSHWLTNMGQFHKELEEKIRDFLQVDNVSLMVNGHLSLELALQALDLPKGGEVITTPFTFISTTHAIVRNGLKPIFCDIKMDDYTIDENKIEELITENTVAILPVHVYGNICNVEAIEKIAYKYNLKVIYDAAHSFGEKYKGKGVAGFGDASIFSFHATKVFNTIEGGAVTFNDPNLYEKLYNLKNFGIRGEELVVGVGANAKMNEFAAIMGLCNLEHVNDNFKARQIKAEYYINKLSELKNIVLPNFTAPGDTEYNYAYFPIRFTQVEKRDQVFDALRSENIFSRKYFYPLTSDAACFKNKYRNLPLDNARLVADSILVLPLYPEINDSDIDRIVDVIKKVLDNI